MCLMIILLVICHQYLAYTSDKKIPILQSKFANKQQYSQLFSYDINKLTQYFVIHFFTFHRESQVSNINFRSFYAPIILVYNKHV